MLRRRSLLKLPAAALAPGGMPADDPAARLNLPSLGRVKPRDSLAIAGSPLSIGFELLDRQLFDPERAYPRLAQLGVKWARTQTGWSRCERVKGEYDFSWLDKVVDSLRNIGVQPWFNLGFGNRLYTPEAEHETAVGFPPLNTAEARQAWVRFTGSIAEHFRTRVQHWEIWNEPNISGFWRPLTPNAESYMELVKMTAPQIRKRIPKAVIVGGALSGVPLEYAGHCLDLGLAKYVDRVSYHPYRRAPEANYDTDVRALRALLARYRPGLAIWQGENGVRSANSIWGLQWNELNQAKWLLRRVLSDLRLELELTSYYHMVDCPKYFIWSKEKSGWQMAAGLLRSDYSPKPSYHAYQCLCALFDSRSRREDLQIDIGQPEKSADKVDIPGIYSASWLRNGHALYAYWYPADFGAPFAPRRVTMSLWSGHSGALADPVLVDSLAAQVHRLPDASRQGQSWKLSAPLVDYPLIVTDRAVVETAGTA